MTMIFLGTHVDTETASLFEQMAKSDRRSKSAMLRVIVERELAAKKFLPTGDNHRFFLPKGDNHPTRRKATKAVKA